MNDPYMDFNKMFSLDQPVESMFYSDDYLNPMKESSDSTQMFHMEPDYLPGNQPLELERELALTEPIFKREPSACCFTHSFYRSKHDLGFE